MNTQLIYQGVDKKDIIVNFVDRKNILNNKGKIYLEKENVETAFTRRPSKAIIYLDNDFSPVVIKVEDSCESKNYWLKIDDDNKFRIYRIDRFKLKFYSDGDFHSTDIPMMIYSPNESYWSYENRMPIHSYNDALSIVTELFSIVYKNNPEQAIKLFDEEYKNEIKKQQKIKRLSQELDKLLESYDLENVPIKHDIDDRIKFVFDSGNYATRYEEEIKYI